MATDFEKKLQELKGERRKLLPNLGGISILVNEPNDDPNNPTVAFSMESVGGPVSYRVTERLNSTGDVALSHELIDYYGAGILEGDVTGHTYVTDGTSDGPVQSGNEGTLVLTQKYEHRGPVRSNVDVIYAQDGNDIVYGYTGDDKLYGGTGDDIIYGGADNDTLHGDEGIDFLYGEEGNDTLKGGADDDYLSGGSGTDVLEGGSGDDSLAGGSGADMLFGGDGYDTLDYSESNAAVTVDLAGTVSGGHADGDVIMGFEAVTGSAYDDMLTGDAGDNTLKGGGGADSLYGGKGVDQLTGGAGADLLDGGEGVDFASYADSAAGVSVDMANNILSGGDAEGDTLVNIEGVIGSAHADVLTGTQQTDYFVGGEGNDAIYAGAGDDIVSGGAGADILDGGAGIDQLDYSASDAGIVVNLATNSASGGHAEGDVISNFEEVVGSAFNDMLFGGAGNDGLVGGDGDDIIFAAAGNDTLGGGAGVDSLYGGTGDDVYLFASGSSGDTVVEQAGEGNDTAYFTDIDATSVSIFKDGNNLLIAANGAQDIMTFQNWYCTDGSYSVENFFFAANNAMFTDEQIANVAVDLSTQTV